MTTEPRDTVAQARLEFGLLRSQAERALAQVDGAAFTAVLDRDANSLAILVKHVAGNLRSRWREPLTTDGEKPDRDRDREFELAADDTRDALMARWAAAFDLVEATLATLSDADLDRPVMIRAQAQPLRAALLRSLTHTAGHVGQIVLLARHLAGPAWTTLSIPRGQSAAYSAEVRGRQRDARTLEPTSPVHAAPSRLGTG